MFDSTLKTHKARQTRKGAQLRLAPAFFVVLMFAAMSLSHAPQAVAEPPVPSEMGKAKMLGKLQAVRSLKLAEVLELEEDSAAMLELNSVLKEYDVQLLKVEEKLRKKTKRVHRAIKEGDLDDEAIETLASEMINHRKRLDELRFKRIDKASKVLSGVRRAKFLFFLPEFEHEFRKAVRKVRREHGPRGRGLFNKPDRPRKKQREGRPPRFDFD